MFDYILSLFSYREQVMLKRLGAAIKNPFTPGAGASFFTRAIASFLVVAELLGALMFELPQAPRGQKIDLNQWTLAWSDEFDGTALDTTKWSSWYTNTPRRGGYWDKNQILVEDGYLKIRTEYKNAGQPNAGWYSGEIETKGLFEKKYGYFECRCICPGGKGLWSAFWTLSEGMFATPDGSAADGCEIDVFESPFFNAGSLKKDGVNQAAGYDGYGANSKGVVVGHYTGKNIYDVFNTYGLEWNENEIIFYINGVETDRLTGVWVPQVKQYLLLSVEVAGTTTETGLGGQPLVVPDPGNNIGDNDPGIFPLDFIVDYVRVYDKIES